MTVTLHDPADPQKLREAVARETNAKQRDRYRAVLLALEDREGDAIAQILGRSPRFVDTWLARYRKAGMAGLLPRKAPGRKPKLTAEQEAILKARLDAGATEADGVCTLRGRDVIVLIEKELGVTHRIGGIYHVLQRLGYSCLKPRPKHRKNDPAAMETFKQSAPFLSRG